MKGNIVTLPNLLSLLRIPLAFAFLQSHATIRLLAVALAMLTDFLDGFLARRYNMLSRVGTTLDPMTDKFFVFCAMGAFLQEGSINWWDAVSMLCRDIAVMIFGLYLILTRQWDNYQFRAIWCGKITTSLQLAVFIALILHYPIPETLFTLFIALGILALIELYIVDPRSSYINN